MSSILVVVNDTLLRFAVVSYLRIKGYSTVEAADTKTALSCAKTYAIEAILLDVHPVSERVNLLQEMRFHFGLRHTPVIALVSSHDRLEPLDKLGPIEYLELPFDMSMLTWMLEEVLVEERYIQGGARPAFVA